MAYHVFIDGQEGTTGLKIKARLADRKDIHLLEIDAAKRKDVDARRTLFEQSDIVFLCLPDAGSREIVGASGGLSGLPTRTRILDASTAHRTDPSWIYGLPELSGSPSGGTKRQEKQRGRIRTAKACAVPGCHATGYILAVRPLTNAGFVPPDAPPPLLSLTGYSGGGKKMIAQYESAQLPNHPTGTPPNKIPPKPYALTQAHKHLPEMVKCAGLTRPPVFTPIVCDYYSGMLVSIPLDLAAMIGPKGRPPTRGEILDCYRECYEDEPMIRLRWEENPEDGFLAADGMAGRDDLEIFLTGGEEQLTAILRYDNLGKGASGAAIQCMNIMLGLEETAGLIMGGRRK